MGVLESLTWVGMLLLALYGCACLIRRITLWLTRCDRSVTLYRLAVPPRGMATEPLVRCLQAQAVWKNDSIQTWVLMPNMTAEDSAVSTRLLIESAAVVPITQQDLITRIMQIYND